MTIQLPPELARLIQEKVSAGHCADETAFVCDALRREFEQDEVQEWVRQATAAGFEQLAAGEFEEITREELQARLALRRAQ